MDTVAIVLGYLFGAIIAGTVVWLLFSVVVTAAAKTTGALVTDKEFRKLYSVIDEIKEDHGNLENKHDDLCGAVASAALRLSKLEESYGRLQPNVGEKTKRVPPRFTASSQDRSQAV